MKLLQLTLETPAQNLALDEALLDAAEAGDISGGVLRLWESPEYCVVLGRSSRADLEVNLSACREANIAVLRRSSGGGTIVVGPGCLMYAVVLDLQTRPQLRAVDLAHQYVLEKLAKMLAPQLLGVSVAGISDLVIRPQPDETTPIDRLPPRKISGNALRVKRNHFLYHGTLLYDFDLNRLSQLLGSATREPDYRGQRSHSEFVSNLPMKQDELAEALIQGWNAESSLSTWPQQRVADLVRQRYAKASNWAIFNPHGP